LAQAVTRNQAARNWPFRGVPVLAALTPRDAGPLVPHIKVIFVSIQIGAYLEVLVVEIGIEMVRLIKVE
jgi:hypothetical protein